MDTEPVVRPGALRQALRKLGRGESEKKKRERPWAAKPGTIRYVKVSQGVGRAEARRGFKRRGHRDPDQVQAKARRRRRRRAKLWG